MVATLPQLPLLYQIWDPLLGKKVVEVWSPPRDARNVTGPHRGVGTGTLDELAGSHTRLAIYPALTIRYQRVVICASLDTRFKGEGSGLSGYHQTTKVTPTKCSPGRTGYMHMNKQVTLSILVMQIPREALR